MQLSNAADVVLSILVRRRYHDRQRRWKFGQVANHNPKGIRQSDEVLIGSTQPSSIVVHVHLMADSHDTCARHPVTFSGLL